MLWRRQVDLNPHQVDVAPLAFHLPLSKGALIADEVRLGKSIEVGLVISQKWAERKRRDSLYHAVQPPQVVIWRIDGEILPALPAFRNQVPQSYNSIGSQIRLEHDCMGDTLTGMLSTGHQAMFRPARASMGEWPTETRSSRFGHSCRP